MTIKKDKISSISVNFQNLQINYNKNLELIFGIFSAYLYVNQELKFDELDFIETPDVEYAKNFYKLIKFEENKELIKYIKYGFNSCDQIPNIAICMNDNYELDEEKLIDIKLNYGSVNEFVFLIKKLAEDIKFDTFYKQNTQYYIKLLEKFSDFNSKFKLNLLEKFYGYKLNSLNYIPSIFINGGFGPKDKLNNCFYIKGFEYDDEIEDFYVNSLAIEECLFHEISHSYINDLVDKHINLFTNLDQLFEDAINSGLHPSYSNGNNKKVLLYEYIVRANTYLLISKVYKDVDIPSEILNMGFYKLYDLAHYIRDNKKQYQNYEDFFLNDLALFINNNFIDGKKTLNKYK